MQQFKFYSNPFYLILFCLFIFAQNSDAFDIKKIDIKNLKIGMTINQFKKKYPKIKIEKELSEGKLEYYKAISENVKVYFTRPDLGNKAFSIIYLKNFKQYLDREEINQVIDKAIKKYGKPAVNTYYNARQRRRFIGYGDCEYFHGLYRVKDMITLEGEGFIIECSGSNIKFILESNKIERMNRDSWRNDVKKSKKNNVKKETDDLF